MSFASFIETVSEAPENKIDDHYPDTLVFNPKYEINVDLLKNPTEKMRGILLNWCKKVLLEILEILENNEILEATLLTVKVLIDYIVFTLLKGRVNRHQLQLIGCSSMLLAMIRLHRANTEQLSKHLADFADNAYTSGQIYKVARHILDRHKEFVTGLKNVYDNYIKFGNVKMTYANPMNSKQYTTPSRPKWESDRDEINNLFLQVIKNATFIRLFRLRSFGIDKNRVSDYELVSHPSINDFFEIVIECANEIMEKVVFDSFDRYLTKNSKKRAIFALACLLIAFKQQGAFDWIYDEPGIARFFGSIVNCYVRELTDLEVPILIFTNWKGCPNVEEWVEKKQYVKTLLQLDDKKLFEFGKKKKKSISSKKSAKKKKEK